MALVRDINPDTDFDGWLKIKQPTTMEEFYQRANQFLRLEETSLVEGNVSDV